jgi:hypothetical protein
MKRAQEDSYNEISFRELVLFVKDYLSIFKTRWWVLLLIGLIGGGVLWYYESKNEINYVAKITYAVNSSSVSGGGSGSILGQFGINKVGEVSADKIIAISESDMMAHSLLLDSLTISGKSDLLGNHLIDYYHLNQEWLIDGETGDYHLSGNNLDSLPLKERRALKRLISILYDRRDGLLKFDANGISDILSIAAETVDAELSMELAYMMYARIQEFYIRESVGDTQSSIDQLETKVDSIYRDLLAKEYQLARVVDRGQNIFSQTYLVERAQLNREVIFLSTSHSETMRSLEAARFSLTAKKPFFQVIDRPYDPLDALYPNPLLWGIIGFVGFAFLAFLLFALRKFYQQLMSAPAYDKDYE